MVPYRGKLMEVEDAGATPGAERSHSVGIDCGSCGRGDSGGCSYAPCRNCSKIGHLAGLSRAG